MTPDIQVKEAVRQKYGAAADRVAQRQANSCCGGASAAMGGCDPITSGLYDASEAGAVPEAAMLASLGCGNPTALPELKPGETVLDLGVNLSGRQGPRAGRSVPGPQARGSLRRVGCARARGSAGVDSEQHGALDRLRRGGLVGPRLPGQVGPSRLRRDRHRGHAGLHGRGRQGVSGGPGCRVAAARSAGRPEVRQRLCPGGQARQAPARPAGIGSLRDSGSTSVMLHTRLLRPEIGEARRRPVAAAQRDAEGD